MAAEATLNDINAQLKEQNKGDKKQTAWKKSYYRLQSL